MEDKDDRQHFSLKGIMDSEKKKSKKKRKRKAKEEEMVDDNFNVDLKDSRFDALFTSHHFAVDPSDPQYRYDECINSPNNSSDNLSFVGRGISLLISSLWTFQIRNTGMMNVRTLQTIHPIISAL